MGKGQQVIKFYTHKANALSLKQITGAQQNPLPILPKDYSLHILFGSTIGPIGVGLMALEGKKSDNDWKKQKFYLMKESSLLKLIRHIKLNLKCKNASMSMNGICLNPQVKVLNLVFTTK
jgi:hypothetical protein